MNALYLQYVREQLMVATADLSGETKGQLLAWLENAQFDTKNYPRKKQRIWDEETESWITLNSPPIPGKQSLAKGSATDQAWEVFEKLEDCYFNQKQPVSARQSHPAIPFPKERRFIVTVSPDGTVDTQPLPDDVFIGKVSSILSDLRQMGWIIIKRDRLVETLATW
ncbi:hypothetical protein ED026_17580 [Salmonella enterica]|nr:hypothetical protein [Salmonella enterica]EAP6952592.1 hypothetical protein [Salmonella enterica]EBJ5338473.1 hypothetical protein [Salmonella enterica]ECK3269492.1 hypothetical protein [Salmonella enterica]ECZ3883528.1 hypothetical protein [Salmonella enterica]